MSKPISNKNKEFKGNYIYLFRKAVYVSENKEIYKIGKSETPLDRAKQYEEGMQILMILEVKDRHKAEVNCIKIFETKFSKEYGNEQFKGDYKKMIETMIKVKFDMETDDNKIELIRPTFNRFFLNDIIESENKMLENKIKECERHIKHLFPDKRKKREKLRIEELNIQIDCHRREVNTNINILKNDYIHKINVKPHKYIQCNICKHKEYINERSNITRENDLYLIYWCEGCSFQKYVFDLKEFDNKSKELDGSNNTFTIQEIEYTKYINNYTTFIPFYFGKNIFDEKINLFIKSNNINFRTNLEKKWALFFTIIGWKWEYKILDKKYTVFIIELNNTHILLEIVSINFISDINDIEITKFVKRVSKINNSSWNGPYIIVGKEISFNNTIPWWGMMIGIFITNKLMKPIWLILNEKGPLVGINHSYAKYEEFEENRIYGEECFNGSDLNMEYKNEILVKKYSNIQPINNQQFAFRYLWDYVNSMYDIDVKYNNDIKESFTGDSYLKFKELYPEIKDLTNTKILGKDDEKNVGKTQSSDLRSRMTGLVNNENESESDGIIQGSIDSDEEEGVNVLTPKMLE